ncbi:unnamed protein product [Paramecium pentaurelia]|uniref:Uncharacterized protein n=1 Tax=Paramecium pentaurelia TaxID=43138 RepID=A0A8S1YEI5_9CILI|nr:unnamed protein product [Paramecium pentaurelia]
MYIRPPEQNNNLAQVGIVNDDLELIKNLKNVEQKLTVEEVIATIGPIPDEINLEHKFSFTDNCYEKQEESIIFTEQLGELKLGGHIKYKCKELYCKKKGSCAHCACFDCCVMCCKLISCCGCNQCCKCSKCCPQYEALHYYQSPSYILQNEIIRFENYSTHAKLYIKDILVLEFHFSLYNCSDKCCGNCKSNIPHIYFKNPLNEKNEKIYFEPLGNKCPTNPRPCFYLCAICSFFGIFQQERNIAVSVGENGSAKIIARRSSKNAFLSQCGCQDCCCHFIDYPDFNIKFTNLSQIQKIGVIMATISYTIHGRWAKYSYRGLLNMNTSYVDF